MQIAVRPSRGSIKGRSRENSLEYVIRNTSQEVRDPEHITINESFHIGKLLRNSKKGAVALSQR